MIWFLDTEYLPIVIVSVSFFATTLLSAIEAIKCRNAIQSATVDDADAPRRTVVPTNNSNDNSTSASPSTSVIHGSLGAGDNSNYDETSGGGTSSSGTSFPVPQVTPPSASFSMAGRKVLQPSFMQERQMHLHQHQHQQQLTMQQQLALHDNSLNGSVSNIQPSLSTDTGQEIPSTTRLTSGGAGVNSHYHSQQKGSKGDQTRLLFYQLLTTALAARCIFLPWEGVIYYNGAGYHQELICLNSPACIMARSLPDVAFASAFSLLVFFYAQLAGTASAGGPRGLSLVLSSNGLFAKGNAVTYAVYSLLLACAFLNWIPLLAFQLCTWALLFVLYGSLLFVLTYFGPVLVTLLGPSLIKPTSRGLTVRLIGMCLVCTLVFLSRMICFGLAMLHRDGRFTHGLVPYWTLPPPIATDVVISEYLDDAVLLRDLFGYALLELLPSLAILLMMHKVKKKTTSRSSAKEDEMLKGDEESIVGQPSSVQTGAVLHSGSGGGGGSSYGSLGGAWNNNSQEQLRPLLSQQSSQTGLGGMRLGEGGGTNNNATRTNYTGTTTTTVTPSHVKMSSKPPAIMSNGNNP